MITRCRMPISKLVQVSGNMWLVERLLVYQPLWTIVNKKPLWTTITDTTNLLVHLAGLWRLIWWPAVSFFWIFSHGDDGFDWCWGQRCSPVMAMVRPRTHKRSCRQLVRPHCSHLSRCGEVPQQLWYVHRGGDFPLENFYPSFVPLSFLLWKMWTLKCPWTGGTSNNKQVQFARFPFGWEHSYAL